jgi:sterol 3beta-glucosyltransferase
MKIVLLTHGSRGDVQPFLALAIGLQKEGHKVLLAAPGRYAQFIDQHSVPFAGLAGDPEEISARFNDAGTNVIHAARAISKYVFTIAPQVVRDVKVALTGADLIVHSFLFTSGGHTFARHLGIPDISIQTFPMFAATRVFPNVAMANIPPGVLSYFSHWLATQIFWHGGNVGYKRLRKQFPQDLPGKLFWPFSKTIDRPLSPLVIAVSPTVLPQPEDWTSAHIHIPGYFFLNEPDYQPPTELVDFLSAGEPPVCVSFGSMVNKDTERIGNVVLEALRRTDQRGVILTGWGHWRPDSTPENTLLLESVPHDWLFPRCKTIVHHGGAGTTAAGLRAGKPNIVVPFAGDQPFWGKRVAALGAGPPAIPIKKLDADTLTGALQLTDDDFMRRRAVEIGRNICNEDGVGTVVKLIEAWGSFWKEDQEPGRGRTKKETEWTVSL